MFLNVQLEYLLFLQSLRGITGHVFDGFFSFITIFGEVLVPVIVMAGIYWCINNKIGMYLFWNSAMAYLSNILIKITACVYRPWMLDSRIHPVPKVLKTADGYSFPSGHTAGSTAVWGGIAIGFWQNKILRYSMILLVLLVAFSRNYLGVHTPQDVLVSLGIGIFFLWFTRKMFIWVEGGKNRDIILTVIITILGVSTILYGCLKSYPMKYVNGHLFINPEEIKLNVISRMGYVLGIFYGWFLDRRFIHFDSKIGTITDKVIRFIVGGSLVCILLTGTKCIFMQCMGSKIGCFIQPFILTLFITAIYPFFITIYHRYKLK